MTKTSQLGLISGLTALLILTAAAAFAFPNADQETGSDAISLSARLDQDRAALDETLNLELEVVWTGQPYQFRFEAPQLAATDSFRLAGTAVANERWEEGGQIHSRRRWRIELQPMTKGALHTPPITLVYASRGSENDTWGPDQQLISPPLPVEITSTVEATVSRHSGWLIASAAGLLAGAGGGFLLIRRRRKGQRKAPAAETDAASPWQELRNRQLELEELLTMGERKKFVTAIDALIRQAVALGFNINLGGMEGARALEILQGRTDDSELLRSAAVILELSDLVKFAGRTPEPDEVDRARREARSLLALLETHGRKQ